MWLFGGLWWSRYSATLSWIHRQASVVMPTSAAFQMPCSPYSGTDAQYYTSFRVWSLAAIKSDTVECKKRLEHVQVRVHCRSATLDNWVEMMLSTMPGQRCDPIVLRTNIHHSQTCGHILAIPYFVSFNFLSAFLVLIRDLLFLSISTIESRVS